MRVLLVPAALAAALLAIEPASADAPAAGFGRRPAQAAPPAYGPRAAPRHYGHGRPVRHYGYGRPPHPHFGHRPFAYGPGDGAAQFEGPAVGMTLYREAYIGRGLYYNTPPTLDRPDFGYGPVLSARY